MSELTVSDRALHERLVQGAAAVDLRVGELAMSNMPALSHVIHSIGSQAANARLDILEGLSPAFVIDEPTAAAVAHSDQALQRRDNRHNSGRSVTDHNGVRHASFPPAQIKRGIDEIYGSFDINKLPHDAVVQQRLQALLAHNQQIIFVTGRPPRQSELIPGSPALELSKLAEPYAQIGTTVRLWSIFQSIGQHREARAARIVVAAHGRRLLGLRHGANSSLTIHRTAS